MHALFVLCRLQILPHLFGKERNERACNQRKRLQRRIQRTVRLKFVRIVSALPESAAISANIPVVHLVDELQHRVNRRAQVVAVESLRNIFHHLLAHRQNPAVKRICRQFLVKLVSRAGNAVDICVLHKERIAVPERQNNALHHVAHALVAVTNLIGTNNGGMHQEQTNCVRTKLVNRFNWVGVIAQTLRHLATVGG